MKWRSGRRSQHVEDRRGRRVSGGVKIGGGLTGLIIILVVEACDTFARAGL